MVAWTVRQLAHFVAVAEAPSLSHAARGLKISQPALSASIRRLEAELGFDLFHRETGFEITEMGRNFLPKARRGVGQMDDLEREVNLLRDGDLGELRIGAGPTIADAVVGQAVGRLISGRPGVTVSIVVREFSELPAMVLDRRLDLAVMDVSQLASHPELAVVPLAAVELVLFCRGGHPLAAGRRVTPETLFQYPLAATHLPPWAEQWLLTHQPDLKPPYLRVNCSHHAALIGVAENSDAISVAPLPSITSLLNDGRLVRLEMEGAPLFSRAGIVHLSRRELSPVAQLLIEELQGSADEIAFKG